MRRGALALIFVGTVAHGEPRPPAASYPERFEASGFLGIGQVGSDLQLGDSWAPEQVPGSAPLVGGRLHVLVAPDLAHDDHFRVQLGLEGELQFASSFTGSTIGEGARRSYFAPVLGWRAHARLRLAADTGALPHVIAGLGGATVASSSPFMRKETDPVFYWGLGVAIPVADAWRVRIDGRHGLMAARTGVTSTFEVQFGVETQFGLPVRQVGSTRVAHAPGQPVVDETDLDHDGLPDRLDQCPSERETVNGIADDDGCPEDDGDADGVIEANDKCPIQAEDLDGFEDLDGCPDPDNDGDGLIDGSDACPLQPETRNGFSDADGCPDELPPEVVNALEVELRFEANRARITRAAGKAVTRLLVALRKHRGLRLSIVGHPHIADRDDLARRRADATKWYLIDQGIAEDRIDTSAGPVDPKHAVTFQLAVP